MQPMPRDESVLVEGLRLHYRHWGGSGQPLVLLHGLASTCHIWDLVAPILCRDFDVVALDQRGHGESDKPDHGYDFPAVSGDLHGFLQALGLERPVLVGHSWGADVALEYAVAHPDTTPGLCFVDGGTIEIAARPDMTLERAKKDMAPPVFSGVTVEQLRQRARSRKWLPSMNSLHEETLLANFQVLDDGTVRARLSRENHMRIIEALWDHRPSRLYPHVQCPVLLLPARQAETDSPDAWHPTREAAIATATRLLPRSKTVWLEDSVHDVPLQRPELTASVIREHIVGGYFD